MEEASQTSPQVRFYRTLAVILAVGVAIGLMVAIADIPTPGWLSVEGAFAGLGVIAVFVFVVTVLFLLRIGSIFELEKQMQELYDGTADRAAAENAKLIASWDGFRDQLRKDLVDMKQEWRTEQGIQDRNTDDAANAARAAMKAVQDLAAKVAANGRDPSQAIAIEKLNEQFAGLSKSVLELKQRDNVNSPLLKELQEAVALLTKNQTKLVQRIDAAMEAMERREMEAVAQRTSAERDAADVKRREALLAVKVRELEDLNVHLADSARRSEVYQIQVKPSEEAQHVMTVEGIGTSYASRLNAVGVITVPQLLAANPDVVGPKVSATPELVREWQTIAQLSAVKGLTGSDAALLAKAGIRSVAHLAAANADDLSRKAQDAERKMNRVGAATVTPGTTQRWIDAARGSN